MLDLAVTLRALETVELAFLDDAPNCFVFEQPVDAPPDDVFAVIVSDPSGWSWFPGLDEGGYEGDAPYGVGSRRWVRMGDDTYRETILAWDGGERRWAYRVDETSSPMFDALAEDWRVFPDGEASVVRWTFAITPAADVVPILDTLPEIVGSVFRQAMHGLSRHLASK